MSRRAIGPSLIGIMLAASVSLAFGEVTRSVKGDMAPPAAGAFTVENLAGSMKVVPGDSNRIELIATVHAESQTIADQMGVEVGSDREGRPCLRIRYPIGTFTTVRYPGGDEPTGLASLFDWGSSRVEYAGHKVKVSGSSGTLMYADVEVRLPKGSLEGKLRNVVGDLSADGVEGKLKFDTASGSVTLRSVRGDLIADTGSGRITANDVSGSLHCDTGSGDCEVRQFTGQLLSCDTGSGDVSVTSVKADRFEADTGSGDVSGDTIAAAHIKADTGSGEIRIRSAETEEIEADTGSGDVELECTGARLRTITADTGSGDVILRLPRDIGFDAIADQGSGDIENDFSDAQATVKGREVIGYHRGDGRVRIMVDTGSGDLVLRPSN